MGGGIYMVGGFWPAPGPYRWVFRYDLAGDVWESFPELAIPDPATGRRNQAAAYIPAAEGRNAGLWTFGGYDGSGANAMTDSSEFYSNILLQPGSWEVLGVPGASAVDPFTQINLAGGSEHTYDLSYTSDVTWNANLPATVGPIASGDVGTFDLTVDIPSDAACGDIGSFTVTSTAQDEPTLTASATVKVRATCGVIGTVTDFDTGLPIENAYVWFQNTADGLDVYYDGYTDAQGHFQMMDVIPDDYLFAASALHHQPSFYPDGWPDGAISFTLLPTEPSVINVSLVASSINWNPQEITVDVVSGKTVVETLTIQNEGSGPYYYNISLLDSSQPEPPAGALAVPGLPRVDEQIFTDIAASTEGVTDFVVVLDSQADVSFAYGIEDWNARGQAVYDVLSNHAETTQQSLRNFLHRQGVDYLPLYIINAVIVKSANADLVNTLAARQDVSQLVANHQIAIEGQSNGYIESLLRPVTVPAAVEWGVSRINADQVWSEYNARGEGTVVAEIDTGTQWDHPALKSQYRGWNGATANHNYNWYDPYFQCPPGGKVPCDPGDHGTHVMGTMVGYDGGANQIGVAPNAQWISCKGGDEVSGYLLTNELLVCAQWILAPTDLNFQNPDPAMRPDVVNNSWGGGRGDYWFTGTIDAWRAAGIFPAFSNGNAGPGCYTAGSPGDNWHSFASGASDINDLIAGFSSRGPALNTGFLKPQVTSPGVNIRSSIPTNGYGSMSGTSMASPHTAGAVALLYSAAPELVGKVDIAAWILERSAQPLYTTEGCGGDLPDTHPNNTFGYGLLDVYAAVNLAKSEDFTPSWVFAYPYGGVIEPGLTETIDVSFYGVNESGTLTGTLWLVGDDPNHPDVRIPLTMNILGLDKFYLPIIKR
jgi:subtilisin family serine protease